MSACASCGMQTKGAREYHPYAACLMMKAARNGNTVEANLRAVVRYGMQAAQLGISLDEAMRDLSAMSRAQIGGGSVSLSPPTEDDPR